jgi:hypothetical protein
MGNDQSAMRVRGPLVYPSAYKYMAGTIVINDELIVPHLCYPHLPFWSYLQLASVVSYRPPSASAQLSHSEGPE